MNCNYCEIRNCNNCLKENDECDHIIKFIENILDIPFFHFVRYKPVIECFLSYLKESGIIKNFDFRIGTWFRDRKDKNIEYCTITYVETKIDLEYKDYDNIITRIEILHRDKTFKEYFPEEQSFIVKRVNYR